MKTLEELGISPAPWERYVGGYSFWVDDNAGEFVCIMASTSMNDRNIGKRNARLIAAAPDLYEALRECLEVLDKLEKYYQGVDAATYKTMAKARAALEKAGGSE